jgi:hypothetical protein
MLSVRLLKSGTSSVVKSVARRKRTKNVAG